jgi:hypothetical protein
VKMDPFIEAEEAAGHSVKRCCELFEVSRAAYFQRRNGEPSARELSDAELTEQIGEVHADSNGTYGSPRVAKELRKRGVACGRRRVRRLMRLAGLEGIPIPIVVADDMTFVEHPGNAERPHAAAHRPIPSLHRPSGWSRSSFVLASLRALHLDQHLRSGARHQEGLDRRGHTGNAHLRMSHRPIADAAAVRSSARMSRDFRTVANVSIRR